MYPTAKAKEQFTQYLADYINEELSRGLTIGEHTIASAIEAFEYGASDGENYILGVTPDYYYDIQGTYGTGTAEREEFLTERVGYEDYEVIRSSSYADAHYYAMEHIEDEAEAFASGYARNLRIRKVQKSTGEVLEVIHVLPTKQQ